MDNPKKMKAKLKVSLMEHGWKVLSEDFIMSGVD